MESSQSPRPDTKRILIVEDNELNMKLLHDVLEAHGYEIIPSHQGGTAIRLAREHRPHLILMDLQLPDISGLEAARQLKDDDETRGIPIIAVTAFAMVGDERKNARERLRRLYRQADHAAPVPGDRRKLHRAGGGSAVIHLAALN